MDSLNAETLFFQERGGNNSFTHEALTLKYKLDNQFELVFVVSGVMLERQVMFATECPLMSPVNCGYCVCDKVIEILGMWRGERKQLLGKVESLAASQDRKPISGGLG